MLYVCVCVCVCLGEYGYTLAGPLFLYGFMFLQFSFYALLCVCVYIFALRSVITTSKQKNNGVLLGTITTEQQCLQRQEDQ